MEYSEFRKEVIKAKGKRTFKITNSYGNKDAWRWVKKNKWLNIGKPISEKDFGHVIKSINKALKEDLLSGRDINLPNRMGRIELRKYKVRIEFKDGKLVTNLPVDWKKTLELWHNDNEAKENKTLIRQETKELFKIYYNRNLANYDNKSFYQFIPIRELKKALRDKIDNNEIDAFCYAVH